MITLEIAYPPSANRIWRKYKGRIVRDPVYVQWLDTEGWKIISQKQGGIAGPYKLTVEAVKPDRRRRDLDNILKPLSDLLKSVGTIDDDSEAEEINLKWVSAGPAVRVRVEKA